MRVAEGLRGVYRVVRASNRPIDRLTDGLTDVDSEAAPGSEI